MNGHYGQQDSQALGNPAGPVLVADVFVQRLGQLKRVVAGMGFAATDAEDILQDVFLQASRAADRYETAENAVRWLIRVTINRCRLEFRRRKRFRGLLAEAGQRLMTEPHTGGGPAEAAILLEDLAAVREALRELEEPLLTPLVLRYFGGLDSGQIGEVLNLPASTVRSRLRDARLLLAKRLKARGV